MVAIALLLAAQAATAPPPALRLTLAPKPACLGVRMELVAPRFAAGEGVVRLPLRLVGIPSARLDGDALTARDARGPLPLVQSEEPPTPQGVYRRWSAARPSEGDVTLAYCAPPRAVTAATNNGPLFDLRQEGAGFVGAGVGFLVTPARAGPYRVALKWDLSAAPPGSRGVWSLGDREGDVETVAPADALAFSYYAAGPLHRVGDDRYGVYWLGQPGFDGDDLGRRIRTLYDTMASFFGHREPSYRVFLRRNPYPGVGGTALARSFAIGYSPADLPTVQRLQRTIAHEIAHNWPRLEGEHGDTAWYSEGAAEYYSMLLARRAGLLSVDELLADANRRASDYYTNPYRGLSNAEAAKRFWSDPTAQTVPYGRGFLYLMRTDAAIRAASGGRRSLDDVVLALRRRQAAGQPGGIAQWIELVGGEIGAARAKADYEAMAAGRTLALPEDRFAPCFRVVAVRERPFELGFARGSLSDDRVVRGLVAGSAAAAAGVRDGDTVLDATPIDRVRSDEDVPMVLRLRRDGGEVSVRYAPRGAPVDSARWERVAGVPDARCTF